jgi:hypothetical protein
MNIDEVAVNARLSSEDEVDEIYKDDEEQR